MFGFLRRKKPAPGDAPPDGDPAAPAGPVDAEALGTQAPAPSPDTEAPEPIALDPAETAPAAPAGGIASRLSALWPFRRGGQPTDAPTQDEADVSSAGNATAEGAPVERATVDPTAPAPLPAEPVAEPAAFEPAPSQPAAFEPAPADPRVEDIRAVTPPAVDSGLGDADTEIETEPFVSEPPPERAGWMARLKQGLSKTRTNLGTLFVGVKVDEALFEELEGALLVADAGMDATTHLLGRLREVVKKERLTEGEQVKRALKDLAAQMLEPLEQPMDIDRAEPLVMMIAGVNGAGKTTSIGKLARHLQRERKSVLLAAGDTFRAAAREQLAQWGERNNVAVIAQAGGDPAAVAFDAVSAARARRIEVVVVDTAGRLPTQLHLMDELKKVRRVVAKAMDGAPHETLLVLDGNTGQNALAQVKAFDEAVPLSGLVVTKLDGTAKGGALIALAHSRRDRPIPVYFIGVGEGIDDLQAFSAREFADALFD